MEHKRNKLWQCKVCGESFLDPSPPHDGVCKKCFGQQEGVKHDKGKPRFDLLPPEALFAIAEILRYGAEIKGYGERNWEKGIKASRLFAATQRHLWKWWGGKDNDEESGLSHLWHALCGLAMLVTTVQRRPDLDDRPLIKK